ncbi:MAG: DUF421 domain-containing protein [Pyrinomonadaceae bacterium]
MFFNSWFNLLSVLVTGVLIYAALIILLRVSGKRTLSKWNAFDFVVTIALGSILATVIMSKDIPLIEGISAFLLLITLQFVITWLSVRFDFVKNIVKAEPTLLLDKGKFLHDAMRRQRIDQSEIRAAIRAKGLAAIENIEAVVLETDGTFSVIEKSSDGSRTALKDIS